MDIKQVLDTIEKTYNQIKHALDEKLTPKSYIIAEEKFHPEAFGSRYVTWYSDTRAVRFVWDGKDEAFVLWTIDRLSQEMPTSWKNTFFKRYDPRSHNSDYVNELINEILLFT